MSYHCIQGEDLSQVVTHVARDLTGVAVAYIHPQCELVCVIDHTVDEGEYMWAQEYIDVQWSTGEHIVV